jgi:hypothetical protein
MRFGALNLFSSFVLVYLFNDLLVFSSRLLTSYRYKGHFPLHSTWVVDLPDTDGMTYTPHHTLTLHTSIAG